MVKFDPRAQRTNTRVIGNLLDSSESRDCILELSLAVRFVEAATQNAAARSVSAKRSQTRPSCSQGFRRTLDCMRSRRYACRPWELSINLPIHAARQFRGVPFNKSMLPALNPQANSGALSSKTCVHSRRALSRKDAQLRGALLNTFLE